MTIEVKKVTKYPPEVFVNASPFNLLAGDNKLDEYNVPKEYIYVFQGFSFPKQNNVKFYANVDGFSEVVKMDDLGAAKGLDYEESIKFPSSRITTLRAYTPSPIIGFPWRYKLAVFEPTTSLKIQLGMPLDAEDSRLDTKFEISQQLALKNPEPFNIYYGIEEYKTQTIRMSSSGTILAINVPSGKKAILTNISATRPMTPASGYVLVERDNVKDILMLDLFCLQSLPYDSPIRIVALERLEITFASVVAGTYEFRVTWGVGRLTLEDKVRWGLDLSESERRKAEELDLFDKIRAGIS